MSLKTRNVKFSHLMIYSLKREIFYSAQDEINCISAAELAVQTQGDLEPVV